MTSESEPGIEGAARPCAWCSVHLTPRNTAAGDVCVLCHLLLKGRDLPDEEIFGYGGGGPSPAGGAA